MKKFWTMFCLIFGGVGLIFLLAGTAIAVAARMKEAGGLTEKILWQQFCLLGGVFFLCGAAGLIAVRRWAARSLSSTVIFCGIILRLIWQEGTLFQCW